MGVTQDVIRNMTQKVLALAVEELKKEESKKHIKDGIVDPLVKMLHGHLMPYLLALVVVIIAILLMSMMTLTLSALFYFKR
jgi:hypothetical protein